MGCGAASLPDTAAGIAIATASMTVKNRRTLPLPSRRGRGENRPARILAGPAHNVEVIFVIWKIDG